MEPVNEATYQQVSRVLISDIDKIPLISGDGWQRSNAGNTNGEVPNTLAEELQLQLESMRGQLPRRPRRRRARTYDGQLYHRNQSGNQRSQRFSRQVVGKSIFQEEQAGYTGLEFDKFMTDMDGVEEKIWREFAETFQGTNTIAGCVDEGAPVIREKSRNAEIHCMNRTRVTLDNGEYIHANWVDGFKKRDAYICTQGPMENTCKEFWMMVHTKNAKNIVMLTETIDKGTGQDMCYQYWPLEEGTRKQYGEILIETSKVTVRHNLFIKTDMLVTRRSTRRSIALHHYRLVALPNLGTQNSNIDCLLSFMSYVNQEVQGRSPLLVHDSDGVSAAGMYMTLDICTHRLQAQDRIDIKRTVQLIRTQRSSCILSGEMYLLVYRAFHSQVLQELELKQMLTVAALTARRRRRLRTLSSRASGSDGARGLTPPQEAVVRWTRRNFDEDRRNRMQVARLNRRLDPEIRRASANIPVCRLEEYEASIRRLEEARDRPNRTPASLRVQLGTRGQPSLNQRLRFASLQVRERVTNIQNHLRACRGH